HPAERPQVSYVEECLKDRKGPVIAATDYVKLHADSIRAFLPSRYRVLGTDGFGRSDTRAQLRHFFEVNRYWIAVHALKALADEAKPADEKRAATPEKPAAPEQPQAAYQTPRKEYGGPTETVPPPVEKQPSVAPPAIDEEAFHKAHAGPGVRKLARELGVDLGRVSGTGPKGRVVPDDVQKFVKSVMTGAATTAPPAAAPKVDFAKFGAVENKPLTRIQKIAGPGLLRNWISIPHVTNCD